MLWASFCFRRVNPEKKREERKKKENKKKVLLPS